jgi:threonyl-tRNA synthetase
MKILQMHSDYIEFKPIKKEIPIAEEIQKKIYKYEDILVAFVTVENNDDEDVAKKAIEEVKASMNVLKTNKLLIYPFSHLSNKLAKPSDALKIIKNMEKTGKEFGIETYRAPFGWNKALNIKVKGHPLAEQSKTFSAIEKTEERTEALKAEKQLNSSWFVLDAKGNMIPVDNFDFSKYKKLELFKNYEINKSRAVQQTPPHVMLMKKLEIADNEPGSDPGNMRYYPKGRLIKSLIETFVTNKVIAYGGMEVETPIMYDLQHPSLVKYLNRFPARQYTLKSENRDFFLRFSACFGQFLIAHDSQISYKNLPYKIYELTRYSFRKEQSGEIAGLRRLRAFTMPDVHSLCADLDQAMKEFVVRFKLSQSVLEGVGLSKDDYELAIRFTKEFYDKNKNFVVSLIKMHGKPALIEMWDDRFFYFILKYEFNFVDNLNKAAALSTDQIDVENGERFGITYVDEKGERKNPIILHCSPSGAVERVIYALLEKAYEEQKNKKIPALPLWLSPIHVRVIPISEKFNKDAERIAEEIERNQIRVDIDDRRETVDKKIRYAELEWIPYSLVIGEKEIKSKKISVRERKTGKIKTLNLKELIEEIKEEIKDKPFKQLSLPKLLSQRPIFVG